MRAVVGNAPTTGLRADIYSPGSASAVLIETAGPVIMRGPHFRPAWTPAASPLTMVSAPDP